MTMINDDHHNHCNDATGGGKYMYFVVFGIDKAAPHHSL